MPGSQPWKTLPFPAVASRWTVVGSLDEISLEGVEGVVSDLDYTLTDFGVGHAKAIEDMRTKHGDRFANAIGETFDLVLEASRRIDQHAWERRGEYRSLLGRMADRQGCSDTHVRKWSRETWIEIARDRLKLNLSHKDVEKARDAYWKDVGEGSPMYPDAERFEARMRERQIPLIIMTASDSVLSGVKGEGFRYDADFARKYKEQRLATLPFRPLHSIIGDPHDKPHPYFFNQVDAAVARAGLREHSRVLAIGDSPGSDLEIPAQRGYVTYHIKRP